METLHSMAYPWFRKINAFGSQSFGIHRHVNSLIPFEFVMNSWKNNRKSYFLAWFFEKIGNIIFFIEKIRILPLRILHSKIRSPNDWGNQNKKNLFSKWDMNDVNFKKQRIKNRDIPWNRVCLRKQKLVFDGS